MLQAPAQVLWEGLWLQGLLQLVVARVCEEEESSAVTEGPALTEHTQELIGCRRDPPVLGSWMRVGWAVVIMG